MDAVVLICGVFAVLLAYLIWDGLRGAAMFPRDDDSKRVKT
jgi:hypothetical protein